MAVYIPTPRLTVFGIRRRFSASECGPYQELRTKDECIEAERPTLFRRIAAAPNEVRTDLRHERNVGGDRHLDIGPRKCTNCPSRERVLIRVRTEHRRIRGQQTLLIASLLTRVHQSLTAGK